MKVAQMINWYHQTINPPYHQKDVFIIFATLFALLIIPITVIATLTSRSLKPEAAPSPVVKSAVLVDSRLYDLVKTDLDEYINYAEGRRGFEIVIDSTNGIDDWSYTQVKSYIQDLKNNYPQLEGILLVGNIKIPSFYKPRGDNLQVRLFTQYYADLDGTFSRLYTPGTIDPKCDGTNEPHCNGIEDHVVPEHDFDYMEKGPNPNPELWIAVLPVGFSTPSQNNYANYANQLRPFFTKAIKFYRGEIPSTKKFYQVSGQLWQMPEIWDYYGPENIDFYSINQFYTNVEKPDGCCALNDYCTNPFGAEACYTRVPFENYSTFQDVWNYYQTRAWMGEGWQIPSIYKPHMIGNSYEFVWVNVHSWGGDSLISSAEAKTLTGGGLVMLGSGCSAAEFYQPGSPSYVNSSISADQNILVNYAYGSSNFVAALGDSFNRGHESYFEKLAPFANQGDYLGQAFLRRWNIQYENSPDPWALRENSQEMLIGDPFMNTSSGGPLPKPGDFNGDNRVDMLDFGKLVHFWGTNEPSCDANGDNIVDIQDFGAIAANWEG